MIILDEKKYAEECLRTGFVDKKPYKTLRILAKYYYHCLGYRKKRITACLTQFMNDYYPTYHQKKDLWDETIKKIANRAGNYPLFQNDGVYITQKELDVIYKLDNDILEKLAFTLLCIAKLNYARNPDTNGWVNTDEKDIFEMAGVNCSSGARSDYICDLRLAGIVEFSQKNTNLSLRVTFMDCGGVGTNFISDFRALGNEYLRLNGGNYVRCNSCGLLIRGNKNGTRKYCDKCRAYSKPEYKTIYCIDCGCQVVVKSKNKRTIRCQSCQSKKITAIKREWARDHLLMKS